jgi:hypothetical protein
MGKPCVLVTLFANITNTGAPSIADIKSIKVILKNGNELELETVSVPLGGIQLKPMELGQLAPRLPSQDYLPIKALNQPIPMGGAALGWTWGLARGVRFAEINDPASKIILPFVDVKGKLYEAKGTLADAKVQAVDSNLLQQ